MHDRARGSVTCLAKRSLPTFCQRTVNNDLSQTEMAPRAKPHICRLIVTKRHGPTRPVSDQIALLIRWSLVRVQHGSLGQSLEGAGLSVFLGRPLKESSRVVLAGMLTESTRRSAYVPGACASYPSRWRVWSAMRGPKGPTGVLLSHKATSTRSASGSSER